MALVPQETAAARVLVVGKDPIITRTLSKLLQLDERIDVLGEAASIGTAPIAELRPDLVIVDEDADGIAGSPDRDYQVCALETLRDLTLNEVLQSVRQLAFLPPLGDQRHLRAIPTPSERDALASLSERELQVVGLVAEGLSNKEISTRLALSDKTVKNHISHILAKMGLTARTQVAVYAIRAGFV
ncbi:MAG TPA: response regulator transcription factor [Candidatus Baltobacteraceae bacterium]|nr:response regulator transcription factor [Candidatus Baltobacteraceae bacterium]